MKTEFTKDDIGKTFEARLPGLKAKICGWNGKDFICRYTDNHWFYCTPQGIPPIMLCTHQIFPGKETAPAQESEFKGQCKIYYRNKLQRSGAPGSVYIEGIHQEHKKEDKAWMRMAIIRYTLVLIAGIIFVWQAYKYLFCNSPLDYLYFVGAIFAYLIAYFIYHINRSSNG